MPKAKKSSPYKATVKVLGKLYEATGASISDALNNLVVPLGRGMSVVTLEHGISVQQRVLPNAQTTKLFSKSPLMREIAIKGISMRFDL